MQQDYKGLTTREAVERLKQNGPNKLPEKPPPSSLSIFFSQLKSPLVYILVAAGTVTTLLGHLTDSIIIAIAVTINAALGFIQERRANQSLHALKQMVHPDAIVIRDGKQIVVPVEKLVVGDVCVLNQGSKIPADGTLLSVNRFYAMEAMLTGESNPVEKEVGDEVFMGTVVSAGRAYMDVTKTGKDTNIGGIALTVQEPVDETPLKKQLIIFSRQLTYLVIILTTIVFLFGMAFQQDLEELFKTSVALAVSAIPEGLLIGLTVVLAIGMQRILKKKGLVRNLVSAETLGGVTTICVDKTGTLTEGIMRVDGFSGNRGELVRQSIIANDHDDPVVIAAYEWAEQFEQTTKLLQKHKRLDSIPFSSKTRYFASLHTYDKHNNILFVNGAPEFVLKWAQSKAVTKNEIKKEIDFETSRGKRLVGMAYKLVPRSKEEISDKDVTANLQWVGMLHLSDPVRKGVEQALERTRTAGIKTLVITGDYANTALHVMEEIGIGSKQTKVILGDELRSYTSSKLDQLLKGFKDVLLFARTTPDQKLTIVESLKRNNEVVAMMGDGVNDAPALNRADIGIVVDNATDVAKESADVILLDSNFTTIVDAVEEGRGIYDNLRKIILYLMSDAFSEIVAVLGAILMQLPLPVTAVQILWINLASDGFPHLALTVDPKNEESMQRPPRKHDEKLLANWMKIIIGIVSLFSGLTTLAIFTHIYRSTGNEVLARSVAFLLLGMNSKLYVFSIRTLTEPIWNVSPFENRWLIFAVIGGYFLHVLPFITSIGQKVFKVINPPVEYWLLVIALSGTIILLIEATKFGMKRRLDHKI